MYSNLIVLATTLCLGVFHVANAAYIPKGTPNGLYVSLTHPNGTEYLQPLDTPKSFSPREDSDLTARAELTKRSGCNPGVLNHADTLSAVGLWRNYCGKGTYLSGVKKYAYVSGSAFAYLCVYPSNGGTCSTTDINTAVSRVTSSCGSYVPGWYTFSSNLAFGYDFTGHNFCF